MLTSVTDYICGYTAVSSGGVVFAEACEGLDIPGGDEAVCRSIEKARSKALEKLFKQACKIPCDNGGNANAVVNLKFSGQAMALETRDVFHASVQGTAMFFARTSRGANGNGFHAGKEKIQEDKGGSDPLPPIEPISWLTRSHLLGAICKMVRSDSGRDEAFHAGEAVYIFPKLIGEAVLAIADGIDGAELPMGAHRGAAGGIQHLARVAVHTCLRDDLAEPVKTKYAGNVYTEKKPGSENQRRVLTPLRLSSFSADQQAAIVPLKRLDVTVEAAKRW